MPLGFLNTPPQHIALETWLVPTLVGDPSGGFIGGHSLVIRGEEPMIVDTSVSLLRASWLDKVFSIVEPTDVRWVFVSHDDHDHVGNLEAVLDLCPNATVVASHSITTRLAGDLPLPPARTRWLDVGESINVGSHVLTAVRPPLFDSPATRGLYDATTQLLWAVDSFMALVPDEIYDRADVPDNLYEESFAIHNSWNTPWLQWVDRRRFERHLATTATLELDLVASAHGPLLWGPEIARAYEGIRSLVGARPAPPPTQPRHEDKATPL
jgi:flavorubredoxin